MWPRSSRGGVSARPVVIGITAEDWMRREAARLRGPRAQGAGAGSCRSTRHGARPRRLPGGGRSGRRYVGAARRPVCARPRARQRTGARSTIADDVRRGRQAVIRPGRPRAAGLCARLVWHQKLPGRACDPPATSRIFLPGLFSKGGRRPMRGDTTDIGPIPGAAEQEPRRTQMGSSRLPWWNRKCIGLLLLGLIVPPCLLIFGPSARRRDTGETSEGDRGHSPS